MIYPLHSLVCSINYKSHRHVDYLFTASGDLRNVIRTVNELPLDYSGELTIVINDRVPHVTLRNMLLLLILGKTSDKRQAADVALHLWYSAFVPIVYYYQALACLTTFMNTIKSEDKSWNVKLTDTSSISGLMTSDVYFLLQSILLAKYGIEDVAKELTRVR